MYYLYILYSPTAGKFYVGSTSDVMKRISYHNTGRSPYTKSKAPWYLVYTEEYETRKEAIVREREIKKWKSSKRIIKEFNINLNNIGSSGPVRTG